MSVPGIARCFSLCLLVLLCVAPSRADTITFEGLSDGTFVSTQYAGLTFSNAIVLTSGLSLNELDFPPRSGVNVVSDTGGAMSINFTTAVSTFSAFFTYVVPVTVRGYSTSNMLLASAVSLFSANFTGGDPGSSPNELIQISSSTAISRVVITGDPGGGSFAADDFTYTSSTVRPTIVPEPSSLPLALFGVTPLFLLRKLIRS